MELGAKIKAARLEAGLSQRQLCGDAITRNMLSQIENGSARPSMATLTYLAGQLGKSLSYFLEEQAVISPNQDCMANARNAWAAGDCGGVVSALEDFREPDATFLQEKQLLLYLGYLGMAQQAIGEDRLPYAVTLLGKAEAVQGSYITEDLVRRRLLLLGQAGQRVSLPSEDGALLLRARQASPERCMEILAAAEDKTAPAWNRLQADALFAQKRYEAAAACYEKAGQDRHVLSRLEECFRELGDYKQAYEYACLLRQATHPEQNL